MKTDYTARAQAIKDDADKSKPNVAAAITNLDITIGWHDQVFEFDTPSVIMKEQKIIMGLPETWIDQQRWVYDLPATRMDNMQTGEYPEVTCGGFLGLECTVKWSPIITKVPTFYMERHEVSLGVPQFAVRDQSLIFGMPEFFMQRQRIVMGLPEIIVRNVSVELGKVENESNALSDAAKRDSATLARSIQNDVRKEGTDGVTAIFQCQRTEASRKKTEALAQIDSQIAMSTSAANAAREAHADKQTKAAESVVAQLVASRATWEAEFEDAFRLLDGAEQTAMASMSTETAPSVSAANSR